MPMTKVDTIASKPIFRRTAMASSDESFIHHRDHRVFKKFYFSVVDDYDGLPSPSGRGAGGEDFQIYGDPSQKTLPRLCCTDCADFEDRENWPT
jgi:hypothetical protein